MNQIQQPRPLCPHLAAASLWTNKHTPMTRNGKTRRIPFARSLGAATDDFLAL